MHLQKFYMIEFFLQSFKHVSLINLINVPFFFEILIFKKIFIHIIWTIYEKEKMFQNLNV